MNCANGKSTLSACAAYCGTSNECRGFWYYDSGGHAGRCCPKTSFNYQFTRVIPGGAFYSYANPALTMNGDPHMRNMAGERFDLALAGTHIALHIPRGAKDTDIQLQLQVNVKQLEGDCDGLFATQILVAGYLLGPAQKIVFEADQFFSVAMGNEVAVHQAGTLWTLATSQEPPAGWPSQEPFDTSMKAALGFNGRPNFEISMGTLKIRVEKAKHKTYNFLNMDVTGVGDIKLPIGGILGFDGHEEASTNPKHCQTRQAKLYQSVADGFFMHVA